MKRVLVLSFTDLATDPRVHRQIAALATRHRVLAAGTAPPACPRASGARGRARR